MKADVFHQRHLLAHWHGSMGADYFARTGDASYREGQPLVIRESAVRESHSSSDWRRVLRQKQRDEALTCQPILSMNAGAASRPLSPKYELRRESPLAARFQFW